MLPVQCDANERINAAFTQAINLLRKSGCFGDAFYLEQVRLERCLQPSNRLPDFIKDAYDAGLLTECVEFLVALADKHPGNAELLNYTAGLLGEMGQRQQSRSFAKMAAARNPLFPSRVKNAKVHTLALQCIATADYRYSPIAGRFYLPGLANLYTLLDPGIAVHRLLVDDLSAALDAVNRLPKCGIILNTISDPDYEEALQNAETVCEALKLPVFNPPRQVREMNRASLPEILHEKSDRLMAARSLYLPPNETKNNDIASAVRNNNFEFPVIVRAPGFQGGRQMTLACGDGDIEALGEELYRGNGVYVIEYVDVSFRDGRAEGCVFYPKYRAFFADGQLFPIHLFVSDQYDVHKKTSFLARSGHPWLLDMETEFLQAPERRFAAGLWNELKTTLSSLGLDYFGVDFAVSTRPEDCGKLVLFECNPAMSNRIVLLPEGEQVQRQWHNVTHAAHAALCKKSGVDAWPFILKKGLIFSLEEKS